MLHRKSSALALVALVAAMAVGPSHARSIRVDSGDWDNSGFLSADSTQAIGFEFNFFGVAASSAQISTDGQVTLTGNGATAELSPFFEPDQGAGGNTVQYQFGTTNAAFSAPGVEAGFRITWQTFDSLGGLLNEFQLSIFDLDGDLFALEFNYNAISFGDGDSRIGFETTLGDAFDLPDALDLDFSEYMGFGDDEFSNNCAGTPTALACNNFYFNTMDFGPGVGVLPDIANGFFRQIDSNGDPVQGRYLFLIGGVQVPEPSSLGLVALGALALAAVRRRARPSRHSIS